MLDAEAMDITSVPTFFINGVRHVGPYDARSLIRALTGSEPEGAGAPAVPPPAAGH
jgi:predicted DsbA family dithiol-disulfide isomerase